MKLLIVTQKADSADPILGFFHRWVVEFAKNFEAVTVICLWEGAHSFPANVRVLSLGKEKGVTKFQIVSNFFKYITREKKSYDAVFVHMNPIYIVLGGILWKFWGKKVSLWYTHREVDLKLRLAAADSDYIFTASKESFQLENAKVIVTGHGIDVAAYASQKRLKPFSEEPIHITCVGRITPIKNQLVMVEAAHILSTKWKKKFDVTFLGTPSTVGDIEYDREVKTLIKQLRIKDKIYFAGNVSPEHMPETLAHFDLSVNLTPKGGVDKVVLEAMATGTLVMSSNEAFRTYFGDYAKSLLFEEGNVDDLAAKIIALFDTTALDPIARALQETVKKKSEVSVLIKTISDQLKKSAGTA